MAKPATRMKSIVLKSYSESRTRLARSPSPSAHSPHAPHAPHSQHGSTERTDCAALSVCCDQPPAAQADVHCSPALRADLRATIEDMVIPRLLGGQCLPAVSALSTSQRRGRVLPTQPEVDLLARIAVQPDLERALELTRGVLSAGLSLETVLLHLIGSAARRLGTDWEDDLRSFAEVTVGLGTLHQLVHLLARHDGGDAIVTGATSHNAFGTDSPHKNALLVGGPGEQHTLGLYIFAELLRHSSWTVTLEAKMASSALVQAVRSQPIDMVGISCSSLERFPAVADLIRSLRRASRNHALRIVLGGPVDLTEEARREAVFFSSDARCAIDWLDGK